VLLCVKALPKAHSANNLHERERDLGVPLLRRLEDEVVERLTDLAANAKVTHASVNSYERTCGVWKFKNFALYYLFWP